MQKNNAFHRRRLDLSGGGPSWTGWSFAPYGKAREFRLIDPDGTNYTAAEISEGRALALDVDFLRGRVRELEAQADTAPLHLTPGEVRALRQAAAILERLPGTSIRRRFPPVLAVVR